MSKEQQLKDASDKLASVAQKWLDKMDTRNVNTITTADAGLARELEDWLKARQA